MPAAIWFLAVPSIVVFVSLLIYLYSNLGRVKASIYLTAAVLYGIVRAMLIDHLVKTEYGSLFPYLMNVSVFRIGAVSLQEIIGWSVAATIAWLTADRFLRMLKLEVAPHRTALVAAFVMSAISLAVETAAMESGWWTWTIKKPQTILGRVPLVGLLDWGFVAFDFLLPYLLFACSCSWTSRFIGLTLFPVHFFLHPSVVPLQEPISLAWNDLSHAAIFCYVLVRAIGEHATAVLPHPAEQRRGWLAFSAVVTVAVSTILADLTTAGSKVSAFASAPLLLLSFPLLKRFPLSDRKEAVAPSKKREPKKKVRKKPAVADSDEWVIFWVRFASVIVVFVALHLWRAPFHRNTKIFLERVQEGVRHLNQQNLTAAEREFRKALVARPDQASGHAVLAHVLIRKGDRAQARKELQRALDLEETHQMALILMTTLDLLEGRFAEAARRASFGIRVYPDRPEFLYLLAKAENQNQKVADAIAFARQGGPQMIYSLANIASTLGDQSTVAAVKR